MSDRPQARADGPDAVAALSLFALFLIAIPSRLIFGPLGGAGTPAQIGGMLLAAYWLIFRAGAALRASLRQPTRIAMLLFLGALLASYIAAMTRPIDPDEKRAADLGMLLALSWFGVHFTAADAVPSRERLDVLLRRVVCIAGALATLGLLQYFTKQPYTNYIKIPGLRANSALVSVYSRGGLTRPAGTALHPIEFGAVLTMALPFALHYAFTDRTRSLVRRWYPVFALATAIPISISRSALVSALVVLAALIPTWSRPVRRRAYVALVAISATLYVLVPGLLGTLTGLFTSINGDSSAKSRTDSYSLAAQFIERRPLFGRGFSTFLPSYRILDNQYLGLLIETGIVGTGCLLALCVTGVITTRRIARRTPAGSVDRGLGHAFAASIASATISLALFDAFSFPMAGGMLFLVLGGAAAYQRLAAPAVDEPLRRAAAPSPRVPAGPVDK